MLKCEHCGEDLLLLEVSLQKTAIYTLIHGDAFDEIIDKDILGEIYTKPQEFKKFARDVIIGGKWLQVEFE